MTDATQPARAPESLSWVQECGLTRPRPSPLAWPMDPHLAWAMGLALPVWVALGGLAGAHMQVPATWVLWLSLVVAQPLLEELVFRGILQGQLLRLTAKAGFSRRWWAPVSLANVLVTIAFVLLHLRSQPLAWALSVAVPSLVFGHLRERFASIWPAVGLHAYYNLGFALTAWWVNAHRAGVHPS